MPHTVNYITKFVSVDGLVGYEYVDRQDIPVEINRHGIACLTARSVDSESYRLCSTSVPIIRRHYRLYGKFFDNQRGVWIAEYREVA